MRSLAKIGLAASAASLLLHAPTGQAQTSTSLDARVQAPQLSAPQRGSLAGQLSSVNFGPGDVSRGTYTLASAFSTPSERGTLLASAFPTYSPEHGASEWGTGWQTRLAITRSRVSGDLDYATDELAGPYGRLLQGSDGFWYPAGLSKHVRVEWAGDVITAYLPDGTRATYGGSVRLANTRGTYAWYLTSVQTATGRKTRIDWTENTTGRRFPTTFWYGGVGDDFQYRIDLAYESLTTPFDDYRSGQKVSLDRRVKTVTVSAKNAQSGLLEERWHHDLTYQGEGLGPGFFLAKVQQVFRSGEMPPPMTYSYHLASERLGTTRFSEVSKVAEVLSTLGADALQPNKSSQLDEGLDGLVDFEHSTSFRLARQTETGFVFESLPAAPTDVYANCRPAVSTTNLPRLLTRLRSGSGDETPYVVDLRLSATGTETFLGVCNRVGQRLKALTLQGSWVPGATVRLVDVNRDHQPDLIRVQSGSYRVLPNTSTPEQFSFGTEKMGSLSPAFTPIASWVHDFNGDGLVDIIARHSGGIVVWYGKGSLQFDGSGRTFLLRTASGTSLSDLSGYSFTFVDANKDGLTDLLLTGMSSNVSTLYVNRGASFLETPVFGLGGVDLSTSKPVVADLSGSGNTEVSYTRNGKGYAVTLDGPETGLMKSADDGKGTVLTFGYARSAPVAGVRQRNSVLASMTLRNSGYDDVTYTYTYAGPRAHGRGKYLVGFDSVTRSGAGAVHAANFLNDDDWSGLPSSSTQHDTRSQGLHSYEYQQYADSLYQGLPWKRLTEQGNGWAQEDGQALGERVEFQAYEAELCPSRTVKYTRHGTLTTEKWRATPSALAGHLHCLDAGTRLTGSHANAALDFLNEVRLVRNSVGMVERVEDLSPTGGVLLLQEVAYRPDFLIDSITTPGKGTTSYVWEPGNLRLRSATTPDGVVLESSVLDPLTDAVQTLTTRRGARSFSQYFRFDGQERLVKQWDDSGAASETTPNQVLAYRYATATHPGSILTTTLIDAALGSFSKRIEWQTASGEAVAKATEFAGGWMVDGLTSRNRNLQETKTHVRPMLAAGIDVTALDYTALLAGADVVGTIVSSGLGLEVRATAHLHADVQREVMTRLFINDGFLIQESTENATHSTLRFLDEAKRSVASQDELGTRYEYGYDALARLREVRLPDGRAHRVSFDEHGRIARIDRDGIGSVVYGYSPLIGLSAYKSFYSATGQHLRKESYTYDGLGRKQHDLHLDVLTGETQSYVYYYDGATPDFSTRSDAPGQLTAVVGEGFTKLFEYRPDGKLSRRVLELTGWRTIETLIHYRDDGSTRADEVSVRKADGTLLWRTTIANTPDVFGRMDTLHLNDQLAATLSYDTRGMLSAASLMGARFLSFSYDSLTRAPIGFSQVGPGLTSSTSWHYGPRGLIDIEGYSTATQMRMRGYTYSPQRFLSSASDSEEIFEYGYDALGQPSSIEENGNEQTVVSHGNTLTVGNTLYVFDTFGRTLSRDDLEFSYGPNGHLAQATRGSVTWGYLYDEAGQRLLKSKDGVPLAAYLPGGTYLDETGLTIPFKIGGRLMATIHNNVFTPVATDMRSSVFAEPNNVLLMSSPYGTRSTRPSMSAALDYVEKGYDSDLGLVRMGVRDYDPAIGRFVTPDPLVLEKPESCITSQVSCNLYSYASSNPINFRDPSGTFEEDVHGALIYHLALLAGWEVHEAAQIALASAGVDHDPATAPTSPLTNAFTPVIERWHFNPSAPSLVDTHVKSGMPSLVEFGRAMHTLLDVGWKDLPGPHARGMPTYFPNIEFKGLAFGDSVSDVVVRSGHGFFFSNNSKGGLAFSWPLSHAADQAWTNPKLNVALFERVFTVLVAAKEAQGVNMPHAPDYAAASQLARDHVNRTTFEQVYYWMDREAPYGAPSYNSLVQLNNSQPANDRLNPYVGWPKVDLSLPKSGNP